MVTERKNLLVVEDNPIQRRMFKLLLGYHDFKVMEAATSEEALSIFNKYKIDLVITDMVLENGNGAQLAIQLRKLNVTIPIILFTGLANFIRKPLEVTEMVGKPIDIQELVNIINTYI